ncbi:MAG: hypothetical protein AAB691_00875 [Patescibacteria group bacterium]
MTKLSILSLVILIAALMVGYSFITQVSSPPKPIACTEEAMLCPDGSSVGRTGPRCEFAECPAVSSSTTPTSTSTGQSGIRGMVLLGPICPVERIPPDPKCAAKPYGTTLVLTSPDQARVIKTFSSDQNGKFVIQIAPGDYAIRSAAAANILPYCASNDTIHVSPGILTEVNVSCDTGIR